MHQDAAPPLCDGRYRLVEVLGQGGMATVYRAWDTKLGVYRAVKLLAPALATNPKTRSRFESEARTMAQLQHPNVVMVHDVGADGDRLFIMMEQVEGGSLAMRLQRAGALPPRQASQVTQATLAALQAAHDMGVVHRDIKPHNVLLTTKGVPKVTDFGIAHAAESDKNLTRTGAVMGTWAYMAPEHRHDAKSADGRSDIYACGAMLYALVTDKEPFDLYSSELHAKLFKGMPEPLCEVIKRATRYEADDRYPTADAMREALQEADARLDPVPADTPPLALPPGDASKAPPPPVGATVIPPSTSPPTAIPPNSMPGVAAAAPGTAVPMTTPPGMGVGPRTGAGSATFDASSLDSEPAPIRPPPGLQQSADATLADHPSVFTIGNTRPPADERRPVAAQPPLPAPVDDEAPAAPVRSRFVLASAAVAALAVVGIVLAAWLRPEAPDDVPSEDEGAATEIAEPTAGDPAIAPAMVPAEATPAAPAAVAADPAPKATSSVPAPTSSNAPSKAAPAKSTTRATPAAAPPPLPEPAPSPAPAAAPAPAPAAAAPTKGRLVLNSKPWGQFTLNGQPGGRTGTGRPGDLEPGTYRIVIISSQPEQGEKSETFTIKAGDELRWCWSFHAGQQC